MTATGKDVDDDLLDEVSSGTNSSEINNTARNIFPNLGIHGKSSRRGSRVSMSSEQPNGDGGAARSLAIARSMQEKAANRQATMARRRNVTRTCYLICEGSIENSYLQMGRALWG